MSTLALVDDGSVTNTFVERNSGFTLHNSATSDNIIDLLLADKRSLETRRAYEADLRDFFSSFAGGIEASPATVQSFLTLPAAKIAECLAFYKANMRDRGLAEASINRRLAAVKSLLKFAYRLGMSQTDGRGLVDGERVQSYRDTRGINVEQMRRLVAAPLKKFGQTPRGLRDTAILLLLCENALRRAEVCKLNESDVDEKESTLRVFGKGKGTQSCKVTVSATFLKSLSMYIHTYKKNNNSIGTGDISDSPLFCNLSRNTHHAGKRLTADGLYKIIGEYGRLIDVDNLTPHKLRHSAITAALDATGGDVRKVAKLSRHAKIETLLIYDDNRLDVQGDITSLLSGLLS